MEQKSEAEKEPQNKPHKEWLEVGRLPAGIGRRGRWDLAMAGQSMNSNTEVSKGFFCGSQFTCELKSAISRSSLLELQRTELCAQVNTFVP